MRMQIFIARSKTSNDFLNLLKTDTVQRNLFFFFEEDYWLKYEFFLKDSNAAASSSENQQKSHNEHHHHSKSEKKTDRCASVAYTSTQVVHQPLPKRPSSSKVTEKNVYRVYSTRTKLCTLTYRVSKQVFFFVKISDFFVTFIENLEKFRQRM